MPKNSKALIKVLEPLVLEVLVSVVLPKVTKALAKKLQAKK